MKNVLTILVGWILFNFLPFGLGLNHANLGPLLSNCNTKMAKIEYIFPGYRFGCYMGKPF